MKIAIIFTCYNRADKTENCVKSLLNQELDKHIKLEFYICDDGSTDNTVKTVRKLIPSAKIINGSGNLFWCKGMYLAMRKAYDNKHDFYLMINDDVNFSPNAIQIMINSYIKSNDICGIVGSVRDENRRTSYGGRVFYNKYKIGKTKLLDSNKTLQKCDVANWNCFLIPNEVLDMIGIIDNYYEHGCGDFDYSLRMMKYGLPIYVATEDVGICSTNPTKNTSQDCSLSKKERIKKLFSIKESPIKSNIYFYKKNYGVFGLLYMVRTYIHNIIYILKSSKLGISYED